MFVWKCTKGREEVFDELKKETFPDSLGQITRHYREFAPWDYHAFLSGSSEAFSIRLANKRNRNSFRKNIYVKINDTATGCTITAKLQYATILRVALYWFLIVALLSVLAVPIGSILQLGAIGDGIFYIFATFFIWLCIIPAYFLSRKSRGARKPKNKLDTKLLSMVSQAADVDYQTEK